MCGIVGYTGKEQASPILLHGLARLEYRGYDSAGLCVAAEGKLHTVKASGKLSNLISLTDNGNNINGTSGVGHTRWATHGNPTDVNAHPHVSKSGNIAVVHNGIIENYRKLKEFLVTKGVEFQSETDTEVVAQLIDYYYQSDLLVAVQQTVSRLEGSYALGIISVHDPDTLIATRKDGPLIVAHENGASFLASDVTAILNYTRNVSYLDDGEFAVLTPDGITFLNAFGAEIEKEISYINWDADAAQKGGYAHYMLKEIYEQPKVCRDTVSPRIVNGRVDLSDAGIDADYLDDIRSIIIIGCGSAYHTGVAGKYWLEKYTRIPTQCVLASEFRYANPIVDNNTLVVVVSQSGETLDTIAALRESKRLGAKTLAIVNVHGSTITREADHTLYIHAGPEISVATTKAYTAQLAALILLTLAIGEKRETISEYETIVAELLALPDKVESVLERVEQVQFLATQYFNHNSVFFIGRNLDYAAAMEAALKLKEISYIHAEAYAGGELKHGTISLIEDRTLVVAMSAYAPLTSKLESNAVEVKARGADILCVTQQHLAGGFAKSANNTVTIPDTHEMLSPILSAIPMQLFAYYVALQRGCDVDQPRNLAKSVTVE